MSERRDPYDDRYGAVIESRQAGTVTVTLDGVAVTEPRRAGWEASDDQRALFIALETARSSEDRVSRITEAECQRARAEWKAAAYTKHAAERNADPRYAVKLAYWQGERDRLRQRDTKAADVRGGH